MVTIPKGVNSYKLTSSYNSENLEWKKGKNKYVGIKKTVSTSPRRVVYSWKVYGRGIGKNEKRVYNSNEKAISSAIKLMRKK